jgi:hypothetical protein
MSLVLASHASSVAVVIAQTVALTGYAVFSILLSRQLHDTLPSHIRAGSSSAVGTLAQLTFIPVTFLFGWLSNTYSVFKAAWMVIVVTILAVVIFCVKVLPRKSAFPGSTHDIL